MNKEDNPTPNIFSNDLLPSYTGPSSVLLAKQQEEAAQRILNGDDSQMDGGSNQVQQGEMSDQRFVKPSLKPSGKIIVSEIPRIWPEGSGRISR